MWDNMYNLILTKKKTQPKAETVTCLVTARNGKIIPNKAFVTTLKGDPLSKGSQRGKQFLGVITVPKKFFTRSVIVRGW